MITNVYIDGFNLYYGCLKWSPYKWLDLGSLCSQLLPQNDIKADPVLHRASQSEAG